MKTEKEAPRATTVESDIGFGLGAIAGATTGLIAGPFGMAVGAAIGGVIGDLAGTAIHDHEVDLAQHDHVLDDEIGVTSGPIGAGPTFGFVAPAEAVTFLRADHDELEAFAERVIAQIERGDQTDVARAITELQEHVLQHIQGEERDLLPAYIRHDPVDAAALIHDHAELRKALAELDLAVELHYLRANALRALLQKLRAHAAREDAGLYPWAKGQGA